MVKNKLRVFIKSQVDMVAWYDINIEPACKKCGAEMIIVFAKTQKLSILIEVSADKELSCLARIREQ
jgi:hypothetical protein